MIPRHLSKTLKAAARDFPVVAVTGPCQSGKTTLVREIGAWERERNAARKPVDWRFTAADARVKLKRPYPQTPV